MKVILESTSETVWIGRADNPERMIPGRIWEGKTESGIYVQAVITRIAAPFESDQTEFQRDLRECVAPARNDVFPLRMII